MAGRDLLQEGLFWRVGNRKQICIWGDKWLPRESTFKVQSLRCRLEEKATVAELVDTNKRCWNRHLVFDIFHESEASIICNIPLSRYNNDDKLI